MQPIEVRRVGVCFTAASLTEVCVWPSPGLVSPRDTGAHRDMNILTFMVGSSVLAPYFTCFARLGWEHRELSSAELFAAVRQLGARAERELMEATAGVNTQRGQLFLLGLAAGVAGLCLARGQRVPSREFYSTVREACDGLCSRELAGLSPCEARTTGERLYLEQGVSGVRGEAEAGFPTVEVTGYPAFEYGLKKGLNVNDAAVHALISIMSVLTDTTVMGRLGKAGILTMHEVAQQILESGSVFTETGRSKIYDAHLRFSSMGLSPGGAADLLALSMALHFIERGLPGKEALTAPSFFERRI